MVLKKLVLSKSGGAYCALVGEMRRFQSFHMIFGHVIQQLPMEHFATNGASTRVLAFVGHVLHASGHQAVRTKQMPFQSLQRVLVLENSLFSLVKM